MALAVVRDGQPRRIEVTLQDAGAAPVAAAPPPAEKPSALGITVSELSPQLARQIGYSEGHGIIVMQVEMSSPAMDAGVERGDVILRINDRPVGQLSQYAQAMREVPAGQMIRLLVRREERKLWRNLWLAFAKR